MVETPTSAKINFNFAFIQMIPKAGQTTGAQERSPYRSARVERHGQQIGNPLSAGRTVRPCLHRFNIGSRPVHLEPAGSIASLMPAPCLNDIASAVQLAADRIEAAADGARAGSNHPASPSGLRRDEPSRGSGFQDSGDTGLNGAQGRDRTTDTAIFSRMLYQLSYLGMSRRGAGSAGL
jgi:hypothetical protein